MRVLWLAASATAVSLVTQQAPEPVRLPLELFHLPDGFEITLWASTPMLHNPTNMDIDKDGRVWVAEGVRYRFHHARRAREKASARDKRIFAPPSREWTGAVSAIRPCANRKSCVLELTSVHRLPSICPPQAIRILDRIRARSDAKRGLTIAAGGFCGRARAIPRHRRDCPGPRKYRGSNNPRRAGPC